MPVFDRLQLVNAEFFAFVESSGDMKHHEGSELIAYMHLLHFICKDHSEEDQGQVEMRGDNIRILNCCDVDAVD